MVDTKFSEIMDAFQQTEFTQDELLEIGCALLQGMLRCDKRNIGNHRAEYELFEGIYRAAYPVDSTSTVLMSCIFLSWSNRSINSYASAYRLGSTDRAQSTKINNAMRATKGRQLIGVASREKVRMSAQSFGHLSKELAAVKISKEVSLSAGTVRRYLSQLFPGGDWK